MSAWTLRQQEIVREYGHLGAEEVSKRIWDECSVRRSPHAVQNFASRSGISLKLRPACPNCGVVGVHLNAISGLCERCNTEQRLMEEVAFNELLEVERQEVMGSTLEEMKRDYAAMRQRNARILKRYNLPTRRERTRGGGCLCTSCKLLSKCAGMRSSLAALAL